MMTKIKLFATDVDGTMTDGCMYYNENGTESKKFNFQDGMGFQLLREAGIKTAIITSEDTSIVQKRAKKLKIDYLSMGTWKKLDYIKHICQELGISLEEVAYIGDDINDIELLSAVGYKACPQNATEEVKKIKNIKILKNKGGEGAIREFIEMLINNNYTNENSNSETISRPWGYYICKDKGINYLTKIICVKPNQQLSLQSHKYRSEHWVVLEGNATVIKNNTIYNLTEGESIDISIDVKHSLQNKTNKDLKILEIQFGEILLEEDIIRYADIYGRS